MTEHANGVKKSKPLTRKKKSRSKSGNPPEDRDQKCKEKLKKTEIELRQQREQLLRIAAELSNVRKRAEREKIQIIQNANEILIRQILPVLDDLERSLKTSSEENQEFRKGIELIMNKFFSILRSHGLEPMQAVGQPFDVGKHEAMMQVEKKDLPSDTVVEEPLKGYLLNGKVIRHARVVLSK